MPLVWHASSYYLISTQMRANMIIAPKPHCLILWWNFEIPQEIYI